VRIRILGRVLSFIISIIAIVVVVVIARQPPADIPEPLDLHNSQMTTTPTATYFLTKTLRVNPTSVITATVTATKTPKPPTQAPSPTASITVTPTDRSTPTITPTITPTPNIIRSGHDEECDLILYEGIQHCTKGPYQIMRIDPKNPYVRFETVLPMGYDRYGEYGECRDVYLPDSVQPGESSGPGCFIDHSYPAERVGIMANRYPGAVVAFNGDFFSSSYAWGPMGLTVKNGKRLDGDENDQDRMEVRRSSLSISRDGDIRIGPVDLELLPDPSRPWEWIPDPDAFYNTIGGLPLLVKNGHPVDLHAQCTREQGWCPDQYYPRARTAFGKTFDGKAIVVIVPETWGLTIEQLSHLMVELGAQEAINLDGGGSSQLWYAGSYLHYTPRHVAEGMIVYSRLITKIGEDPEAGQ
jgi:hypothetical protein